MCLLSHQSEEVPRGTARSSLKLRSCRSDGKARYRYRVDGSFSKRPQVGGFATREELNERSGESSRGSAPDAR